MTTQNFTIDVKHDQMMEYFTNLEDTIIPNLTKEKDKSFYCKNCEKQCFKFYLRGSCKTVFVKNNEYSNVKKRF